MKRYLLLLLFPFLTTSCHVGRTIVWNFAAYDDFNKFDQLNISKSDASSTPYFHKIDNQTLLAGDSLGDVFLQQTNFEQFLIDHHTTSFIVLKGDTIIYENYFNGYQSTELHSVYSVSKSFISLLIGIALEEGKIESLSNPISKYVPALNDAEIADITLQELIDMESGIKFSEWYYNPFGDLSKYFYGNNLKKYMKKSKMKDMPEGFDYVSVNTDLLGWALESAIDKSIAEYLEEKVWQPLEMKHDATWSLDSEKHGTPKFSFGLNTRTSDLLKLGYLYLNDGKFNGKNIVSSEWINRISEVELEKSNQPNYKNHWWREVTYKDSLQSGEENRILDVFDVKHQQGNAQKIYKIFTGNYYAAGFLGQFIYVCPKQNMVIIRTGKKQGKTDWIKLFRLIAEKQN